MLDRTWKNAVPSFWKRPQIYPNEEKIEIQIFFSIYLLFLTHFSIPFSISRFYLDVRIILVIVISKVIFVLFMETFQRSKEHKTFLDF